MILPAILIAASCLTPDDVLNIYRKCKADMLSVPECAESYENQDPPRKDFRQDRDYWGELELETSYMVTTCGELLQVCLVSKGYYSTKICKPGSVAMGKNTHCV